MKTYIKKFYLLALLLALVFSVLEFLEFNHTKKSLIREIEKNILLKKENVVFSIKNTLLNKSKIIDVLSTYISQKKQLENENLELMKLFLEKNRSFSSLYYVNENNKMLNASGWKPPPEIDFRTRPWYIKAKKDEKLSFTEPFLNASQSQIITTISRPVFEENILLGVVGGDINLNDLMALILKEKISQNSYFFLTNTIGEIIVHPDYKNYSDLKRLNIEDIYNKDILKYFVENNNSKFVENGIYLSMEEIEELNLLLFTFVPLNDFIDIEKEFYLKFILVLSSMLMTILFFIGFNKKLIVNPMIELENDIDKIPIEDNFSFRLIEKDPFFILRENINKLLDKKENYFNKMLESNKNLENANYELEASLNQLLAIENELRNQYDELLLSKEALKISENRNKAIVNALPDIIFRINSAGIFLDCQYKIEEDLLLSPDKFLGKNISDVIPKEIGEKALECIRQALETNEVQELQYSLEMPKGIAYYELRFVKSDIEEVIAILRDISKQRKDQLYIEYLSYHDQLTGLYNRRFMEEELKRLDTERNLPFTIVMLDVNGLKLTNDAFGHTLGDNLLKKVADSLKKLCRFDDIVARLGGDEFIILLPKTSNKEAEIMLDRMKKSLSQEKVENILLSVSLGWETKENQNELMKDIFIKAEDNMYQQKLLESQNIRNQMVEVIFKSLKDRDSKEKNHSERVSFISKSIGEELNLSLEFIRDLEIAGAMHDIGKISVDESLLNKKGILTWDEYEEIKKHSNNGYQILKSVDKYSKIAEYILYHHERWDGKGYPVGLKENEIPLASRILSLADAYDAMTSDKAYRQAFTKEKAIEEIINNSSKQFDPELVDIFINKVYKKL